MKKTKIGTVIPALLNSIAYSTKQQKEMAPFSNSCAACTTPCPHALLFTTGTIAYAPVNAYRTTNLNCIQYTLEENMLIYAQSTVTKGGMMTEQHSCFSSYQSGEGRTGTGQLVSFTCPSDKTDSVRNFLREHIRTIKPHDTRFATVNHGGFCRHTRYDIVQHDYAGGGAEYVELLEIRNPPDNRYGYVINQHSPADSSFTEWDSLERARSAYTAFFFRPSGTVLSSFPGFLREVSCGPLTPWFFAVGDEELFGDYASPHNLQEHPVFRFGRQFVVHDNNDLPTVKTCMGARYRKEEVSRYSSHNARNLLTVFWDDGTVWNEEYSYPTAPHPLEDGEIWITEALRQFRKFLTGRTEKFSVNLTDGTTFIGRLKKTGTRSFSPEGDYYVTCRIVGEEKVREGWVHFTPTPEAPDVVQLVTRSFAERGKKVVCLEVTRRESKRNGKKWSGVFFSPRSADR